MKWGQKSRVLLGHRFSTFSTFFSLFDQIHLLGKMCKKGLRHTNNRRIHTQQPI